jgi:hypothetical protein
MITKELLRALGERALRAALVVFVGASSGDAINLFQLDWPQIGAAMLGAAVLDAALGLLAATGVVGDKGSPALIHEKKEN